MILNKKFVVILLVVFIASFGMSGCESAPTSDDIANKQQETILKEAVNSIGMPAITNFREKRFMKDILEMRDQEGIVTYLYLENVVPVVVPGHTVAGGKLTYIGQTIGYGLPAAAQYTNPLKVERESVNYGYAITAQADPNGLYMPSSAEGTWIIMNDPSSEDTGVVYSEPRMMVFPFKLPLDQ